MKPAAIIAAAVAIAAAVWVDFRKSTWDACCPCCGFEDDDDPEC